MGCPREVQLMKCRVLAIFIFSIVAVDGWSQCAARPEGLATPHSFAATAPVSSQSYSLPDRGAMTADTGGDGGSSVGYARLQPSSGTTPSGYLTFQFRQNDILVGQASVPAAVATQSGRIYAEVGGAVNTGVAIANPNGAAAAISFYLTDTAGTQLARGNFTIPPNGQISRFLTEAPFNAGPFQGTLTFTSTVPVGVIALRGYTNERSEFLITTLPVSSLSASGSGSAYMPHFADGGGWTTQVILVNPTDQPISGTVQFFSQGDASTSGQPITMTVAGQTAAAFPYAIPGRSSVRLATSGAASDITAGSVQVMPAGGSGTPSGLAIFAFRNNGVVVSEAGVPALGTSTAFRMYEYECGDYPGQIQTGIAIANPSGTPAAVNIELTDKSGATTGLTAALTVPAFGQVARFMKQLIPSIPYPFHGVARITTSSAAGVSVIGLRGDYNARNDFLITTAMPNNENLPPTAGEAIFPHFVNGGGYTTEFVLFSGSSSQFGGGVLRFYDQNGQPMSMTLQ